MVEQLAVLYFLRSLRGKPWSENRVNCRETFKMVIRSQAQPFYKRELGRFRDYTPDSVALFLPEMR